MLFLAILFIIALVVFLIITPKKQTKDQGYPPLWNIIRKWGIIGSMVLAILFSSLSSCAIVQPGHRGVVITFGSVSPNVRNDGIAFKPPWSTVKSMDARLQEYTMSIVSTEGHNQGNDAIDVLTKDGVTANLDVTVWWKLNPIKCAEIYRNIGMEYEEVVIRPAIREAIRSTAALFTLEELYSTKRQEYVKMAQDTLLVNLKAKGFIMDKMLLRNVKLPNEINNAINAKLAAKQQAEQMEFVLQKEKQEAERKRIEAAGIRDFQLTVQQGITPSLIEWKRIEMMEKIGGGKAIFVPYGSGINAFLNP